MIARQGSGARETFTVRKQSFGVGVERTFPVHSPKIERLEVVARGDVRRAKLYYLRGRVGKRARVAERRWGIEDDLVLAEAEEPEAIDSEGVTPGGGRAGAADAEAEAEDADEATERRRGRGSRRARARSEAAGRRRAGRGAEPRRPRSPAARPRVPRKPADPEADNRPRRGPRAGRHRRAGDRARARDPGVRRQAVPDPLASRWSRRSTSASGCWSTASSTRLGADPELGDVVVFHPPAGRDRRRQVRRPEPQPGQPCPEPTPDEADENFIKRVVAGPGDTLRDRGRDPDRQRRAVRGRLGNSPMSRTRRLRFPRARSPSHPTTTS